MRTWIWVASLLSACTSGGTTDGGVVGPGGGDPTLPTDTGPTTTESKTGPDCPISPTMGVSSLEVIAGPRSNQFEFQVELAEPGAVAVLCTAVDDPTEQHLVEALAEGTSHTLRMSGLLATWSYTCQVAPTCPTMAADPLVVKLDVQPPPRTFPFASVTVDPDLGMTGAWTLMGKPLNGANNWVLIYDDQGRPRWWQELPGSLFDVEALYDASDHTVVWGGGGAPEGRAHVEHIWEGTQYTADVKGWEADRFHHDGKRIADGRILLLDAVDNSGTTGKSWEGFRVRLLDPSTGNVDLEVNSQRYVDEGLLREAGGWFDTDPYHANWMDWRETPDGPVLYVSLCFDHQFVAIDGTNGDMLWQLGPDRGWTVLDEAGGSLPDTELPQCQHGPELLGDRILFYDNAQDRPRSRAVEWRIDVDKRVAQRMWMWEEDGWQEDFLGDIDYLPSGRVLVTQARFGFGTNTDIVEIVPETGAVASRVTFDSNGAGYRSERYDGCEIFASVAHCDGLQTRLAQLAYVLE